MPGGEELGQQRVDLADDARRQAERQLVEQQDPRVGDERPPDRHRLLLAARELRRALAAPLGHPREELVDPLDGPRARPAAVRADQEVLLDA